MGHFRSHAVGALRRYDHSQEDVRYYPPQHEAEQNAVYSVPGSGRPARQSEQPVCDYQGYAREYEGQHDQQNALMDADCLSQTAGDRLRCHCRDDRARGLE